MLRAEWRGRLNPRGASSWAPWRTNRLGWNSEDREALSPTKGHGQGGQAAVGGSFGETITSVLTRPHLGPPPPMHAWGSGLGISICPTLSRSVPRGLMPTPCPAPSLTAIIRGTPSAFRGGGTHGLGTRQGAGAVSFCGQVLWAGHRLKLETQQSGVGTPASRPIWGLGTPTEGQCGDGLFLPPETCWGYTGHNETQAFT